MYIFELLCRHLSMCGLEKNLNEFKLVHSVFIFIVIKDVFCTIVQPEIKEQFKETIKAD